MNLSQSTLSQLHSQASVCTERLSLPLRSQVWRGMAGEFQGAGTGSSIDFQDHRSYVPGDDPRHINWQAYARTGHYSMKLYREEVRPVIDIILDVSESMLFDETKAARCAELFYFACHCAMQAGAATHLYLLRGDAYRPIPMDAVIAHQWADTISSIPAENPALPLALDRIPMRGNAIRVLISDLLFDGEPSIPLRALTQRQGRPIIFTPYLTSEVSPTWQGNYEFVDSEQPGAHAHRVEASTLKRYHKAYSRHFGQWHTSSRRFNCPLARVSCNTDLLTALNEEALKAGALVIR